jgi:CPA1 family monovalent cation:H+ antiporter
MQAIAIVLVFLLAVVVSGFLARVTRLPAPLVQIALGATLHGVGVKTVALEPDLFFLLFLPPLLFLDGWRIPNEALRRDAGTILTLALGLVVVTVLGMGAFIHLLIPAMPLAVAFALAAVISPTDPIAVSAIAGNTQIPRRLMHILHGESLLNDASGLVCLRFAVAAAVAGSFSLGDALVSFVWVAGTGLAVGAGLTFVVARTMAWSSARFGDDGGGQILVTLLIPFGVYLLAEKLGGSGILAAVAAGVTMSVADVWPWRAATRLRRTAVWDTVQLAANGSIFVLLGEQMPALVQAAPRTVLATAHGNPWWQALYVAVIVLALALLRCAWVWASISIAALAARLRGHTAPRPGWRLVLATSLAGVRGAVTLAGVLTLPGALGDGTPFPMRDEAILLAAGVIVLWLVIATIALPPTLRGLVWPAQSAPQAGAERARRAAAEAAIRALQGAQALPDADHAAAMRLADAASGLIALYRLRLVRLSADHPARDPVTGADAAERRLRLLGIHAERAEVQRIADEGGIEDPVLHTLLRELDLQEARFAN